MYNFSFSYTGSAIFYNFSNSLRASLSAYLEQSTLGETATGKVILQFAGRAWANCWLGFIFWAAFLMHAHAAFLSAELVAAFASADTPAQHAGGGIPEPLLR